MTLPSFGAHVSADGVSFRLWTPAAQRVDLLLDQPSVDKKEVLVWGAVAGGGDPAAVTAALDSRVAAVVPVTFREVVGRVLHEARHHVLARRCDGRIREARNDDVDVGPPRNPLPLC